jgi:hypothetical protein
VSEIYRKRGRVVRWEHGTLVRVIEAGIAIEDGESFECRPELMDALPVWSSGVVEVARQLAALSLERLVISEGRAEHECNGVQWHDETRRVHASLVKGHLRALVDLASFDLDDVHRIADVLARAALNERRAPSRLRLAPNVTAALLPHLHTSIQMEGGMDGKGRPIVEARGEWPNWYRPSYRVRPVRMPLNLRADCEVESIDASLPLAVALLAPIEDQVLRVLVDDGARVFPATARVTALRAAAPPRTWYPYGGGAWGAESLAHPE